MLKFGSTALATLLMLCGLPAYPDRHSANAATAGYSTPEQQKNLTPPAQASDPEKVEARLTALFDLCRRDDLQAAAAYFVYRGPDKSREWKDVFNSGESEERSAVKASVAESRAIWMRAMATSSARSKWRGNGKANGTRSKSLFSRASRRRKPSSRFFSSKASSPSVILISLGFT